MKSRYHIGNLTDGNHILTSALSLIMLLSVGCATVVFDGTSGVAAEKHDIRILLPPFFNATNDDHAGRALTELTGTALVERGFPLYQTEEILISAKGEAAPGPDGRYQELAATVGATHLAIGTVHEYRYKTDLDGDPAVGITIRIVDARDGRTVWQGSSSNVGYAFASLSSASQRAVRRLVQRIQIDSTEMDDTPQQAVVQSDGVDVESSEGAIAENVGEAGAGGDSSADTLTEVLVED